MTRLFVGMGLVVCTALVSGAERNEPSQKRNEANAASRERTIPVQPDLSSRPFQLKIERTMTAPPGRLFQAWTKHFDHWLAAPGTLLMKPEVDAPFYFEVRFNGQRYPHYGRFLKLVADRRVELTWLTGEPGTKGDESPARVSRGRIRARHGGNQKKRRSDEGNRRGERRKAVIYQRSVVTRLH